MSKVRVVIIGVGNMGRVHLQSFGQGEIADAELVGVCDLDPDRLAWAVEQFCGDLRTYDRLETLYAAAAEGLFDAVIVATPHYDHPPVAMACLQRGLHVMCEKPAGVYTQAVRQMNEVAKRCAKERQTVFGIMYNQRTDPTYQKLRKLIRARELGAIRRINWMITDWYRPQSYYDSGSWRATWAGEGGGVLINQCPHQLDLWQWFFGLPRRVRCFCGYGKMHDIEVEDDVTAYMEYENGATGVFITSTGDLPGTNRLELNADRGKIVIEEGKMTFWRNRVPEREFNANCKDGINYQAEVWKCAIPIVGQGGQHIGILNDWITAIQQGTPQLSPGLEGIYGLTLSNAFHLSSWLDDWVGIPYNEEQFYRLLQERIAGSKSSSVVKM